MIPLREGELLLAVRSDRPSEHVFPLVFMLGHVEAHFLFVAPLGSPPFGAPHWILIGPADDLPADHALGDIAAAFRRACADLS